MNSSAMWRRIFFQVISGQIFDPGEALLELLVPQEADKEYKML